jgi:hypothetical protein
MAGKSDESEKIAAAAVSDGGPGQWMPWRFMEQ